MAAPGRSDVEAFHDKAQKLVTRLGLSGAPMAPQFVVRQAGGRMGAMISDGRTRSTRGTKGGG